METGKLPRGACRHWAFVMRRAALVIFFIPVVCLASGCQQKMKPDPQIATAIASLHSSDKAEREKGQVELQRIGRIPDQRSATIRLVIAVLEESGVHYSAWYAAAEVLGALEATEGVDVLVRHIDYKEGIAEFPDGASAATWALFQIGEPAVSALAVRLSNGEVAAREKAADALGLIKGERAEQALRRARQVEKEKRVADAIDDSLRRIESERSERRERTEPAAVARNCLSASSSEFKARPVKMLFLDGQSTRVDETLCHVEAFGSVSEHGNWWLVRTTPSGIESSRIGTNSFLGYSINEFLPSPDGKYLAVLSSAEGAPFIQVVDLMEFVRRKTMKPVGELGVGINGSVSLKGWNGSMLELQSTMLIGYGTELLGTDEELFSWNVNTGAVVPQSRVLRDPNRYYCSFVTAPDPYTRGIAAVALRRFRSQSSASCIEAALKRFPNDPDLKSSLRYIQARISPPSSGDQVLIVSGAGADRRIAQSDTAGFLEHASISVPEDITPESIAAGLKNVVWDREGLRAAVAFEREEGSFVVAFVTNKDYTVLASDISRAENANIAVLGPGRVYVRRSTVPAEWQTGTGFLVIRTEAWDGSGKHYTATDFLKFDERTGLPVWR
jgi:hypothetical protein